MSPNYQCPRRKQSENIITNQNQLIDLTRIGGKGIIPHLTVRMKCHMCHTKQAFATEYGNREKNIFSNRSDGSLT